MIKFIIDKSNPIAYNKMDFYLAHNLYNYAIYNKNQKDEKFEFVNYVNDNMPFQRINIRSINITGRTGVNYCLTLDNCCFNFKFKGHMVNCLVETDKEMPFTVSHDEKIYAKVTLSFEDKDKAGELFDCLIKESVSYSEKYMLECDFDSNKLNIYMNDEGYWEKVITRKKRAMDTIYLPEKDKNLIINDIIKFLEPETHKRYDSLGRTHKRVYLFEGLPGTGKTSFIAALASMVDYDIASITFTDKVTDGGLIRLIKNIPEKTFLVLEDIDVLFNERKKNDGHKNNVTFSGILNSLDGITTKDGFICFITTNYKNLLDPALLRPGRIDKQLEFKAATKDQINTMFVKFMDTEYTEEKFADFYSRYKALNIEVTMSLIQEYMFKYLDDPENAIKNVAELKTLYNSCVKDKSGELYS